MNKCPINTNFNKIGQEIVDIIYDTEEDHLLKSKLIDYLKTIKENYAISETKDIKNISNYIYNLLTNERVMDIINIDQDQIIAEINNLERKQNNTLETSIEQITDQKIINNRRNVSYVFLNNYYGSAKSVKDYMLKNSLRNLMNSVFINRDAEFIEIGKKTSNDTELVENLLQYQEYLFNIIKQYLLPILERNSDKYINEINLLNQQLFYKNNNNYIYTNCLENLKPLFNVYFSTKENFLPANLIEYQLDSENNNSPTKEQSKLKIDAFNAYVILNNFDSFLHLQLPKSITINNFGQRIDLINKYRFSNKTSNLLTTWRDNDVVDPSNEFGEIVSNFIITSKIYNRYNDQELENQYMSLRDFITIISKIKDLSKLEYFQKYKFDQFNDSNVIDSLNNNIRNNIVGKTLSQLIDIIRINPKENLTTVFNIISNDQFIDQHHTTLKSIFTDKQLNIIYSLNKQFFSRNNNNSLYNLINATDLIDYHSFICQQADSIFSVTQLQYYKDDSGKIKLTTLKDFTLQNLKRQIETTINVDNDISLAENLDKSSINGDTQTKMTSFSYTLNYGRKTIQLELNANCKLSQYPEITDENKDIFKNFIEDSLKIDIFSDEEFYKTLINEKGGSENKILSDFLEFALRIKLAQKLTSNAVEKNIRITEELLNKTFINSPFKYNYTFDQINMVSDLDIPLLELIAKVEYLNSKSFSANTAKASDGNFQSLQTLSRVLGSYRTQWLDQEKSNDSPTKDLIIMNSGVLLDIVNALEYNDKKGDSKKYTKMNLSEMIGCTLMYDFIHGLTYTKDEIVGNGKVLILSSVNSNKNTISKLLVDLNKEVTLQNGVVKSIKDLDKDELIQFISDEFYKFYVNILRNILTDYKQLNKFFEKAYPDLPDLSTDYFNNFTKFNEYCYTKGYQPKQFLDHLIYQFNLNNFNKIELVLDIHYSYNKNGIFNNESLLSQVYRYNTNKTIQSLRKYVSEERVQHFQKNFIDAQSFFSKKEVEIIEGLLNSNYDIDLSKYPDNESSYIKDNFQDWVSDSNKVIYFKLLNGNKEISITSLNDLRIALNQKDCDLTVRDLLNLAINGEAFKYELQLNPIIQKYNLLQFLFSQEFMFTTEGSFIGHPVKTKSNDVLKQESSQFLAQHKRNSDLTASVHEFTLNLLNGIPENYNIAVFEDVFDFQETIYGITHTIKPFDGATFVNPINVILENNSLCEQKAGITKKHYIHFKNHRTGTGGMIKTCGFGLTNDWIRNSKLLQTMAETMMQHDWKNQNGSIFTGNIFIDYNGNNIIFDNKGLYYKDGNNFYKIKNFYRNDDKTYTKIITQVNEFGTEISNDIQLDNIQLKSNYDLWKFFGGEYSLSMKNGKLQYSNSSIENVVNIVNNVGVKLNNNNKITSQEDLYQPLKHSDIHLIPTQGAVKMGIANINSSVKFNDNNGVNIQTIRMTQSGIQLDKEHHADNSELSLMTQVINACAAKGYTFEQASQLYDALAKISYENVKDHMKLLEDVFDADGNVLLELINKTLLKAFANNRTNRHNFLEIMANQLMEEVKQGNAVKFSEKIIPLSDNVVYSRIVSTLSSFLTNSGIKQKIPGILSVLTPSFNIMKLYDDRKLESFTNFETEIEELQSQVIPVYSTSREDSDIHKLELGRSYDITYLKQSRIYNEGDIINDNEIILTKDGIKYVYTPSFKTQLINTQKQYRQLKEYIKQGLILEVKENLKQGRELAAYNVRFNVLDEETKYQLWDIDSLYYLEKLQEIKEKGSNQDDINYLYEQLFGRNPTNKINIQYLEKIIKRWVQKDLLNLSENNHDNNDKYNQLLNTKPEAPDKEWFERYTRIVNILTEEYNGNYINVNGNLIEVTSDNFEEINKIVKSKLIKDTYVIIDGQPKKIDKSSLETFPYELIMSKTFATSFGLTEFDDLNIISNDQDFFLKRYLENNIVKVNEENYTVSLKKSNGDHYYLLTTDQLINTTGLQKVQIYTSYEDDILYRIDTNGEIMYEITDNTSIYTDNYGNEIIVSDNLNFYINNLNYDNIQISNIIENKQLRNIINILKESSNESAKDFYNLIKKHISNLDNVRQINTKLNGVNIYNYEEDSYYEQIYHLRKLYRKKHTSFLKSLEVVAARIPAQSMQSFMPMKIVAFDNPDINTAYVSTLQILLQGSDYDVDAVSIATYDIDKNGMLKLWSPYANIESIELINACEKIPFPSGKELVINEVNNEDNLYDFIKHFEYLLDIQETFDENGNTKDEVYFNLILDDISKVEDFITFLQEAQSLRVPINKALIAEKLGYTINQINSIINNIKHVYDKHNKYLEKLSKYTLFRVVNNYSFLQMKRIINNPSNLLQSHAPIDECTKVMKQITSQKFDSSSLTERTAGNFINMLESIIENKVGDECIGICAVGLKSQLFMTQYANKVLNEPVTEDNYEEQSKKQKRLLFNDSGISLGNLKRNLLANIRTLNPNNIINDEVLKFLSETSQDEDSILLISGLLSLAVDNAKELELFKLNATPKTIGMYIAGLCMGFDLNTLSDILMSSVAKILLSDTEGNILTNDYDQFHIKDFNFDRYINRKETYWIMLKELKSLPGIQMVLENLNFEDSSHKLEQLVDLMKKDDNTSIYNRLVNLRKNKEIVEGLENQKVFDFYKTIDHLLKYCMNRRTIFKSPSSKNNFYNIRTLSRCAQELKLIGQIVGINKGLKSKPDELYKQLSNFENAIYDITNNEADIVDISKFVKDASYRNSVIENYESKKTAFNIYEIMYNNQILFQYLKLLAILKLQLQTTFKFRSSLKLQNFSKQLIGYSKNLIKNLNRLSGWWAINSFLRENNTRIIIPKGSNYVDANGKIHRYTKDTPILLGTDIGNATFKLWFENKVIKDLKKGILEHKSKNSNPIISKNNFIKKLKRNIFNKTPLGNDLIIYSLPINMSPTNDSEEALLKLYQADFEKIANYYYIYDYTYNDENGTQITEEIKIPLKDLFTYYSLIVNEWRPGEKSLVSILEESENHILEDFHEFIYNLDTSRFTLDNNLISIDELLQFIVEFKSIKDLGKYYGKNRNMSSGLIQIVKIDRESESGISYKSIKNPKTLPYGINNSKYYRFTMEIDGKQSTIDVTYNTDNDDVIINIDGKPLLNPEFSKGSKKAKFFTIPKIKKINSENIKLPISEPSQEIIEMIINQQINCK